MIWRGKTKGQQKEGTGNEDPKSGLGRSGKSEPRRIYAYENIWGRQPIRAYLAIDRFRSGDNWHPSRDSLKEFVQSKLLTEAARYPLGSISLYRVWDEIIPNVCPTHWITAGFRCKIDRSQKCPIVKVPVCLPERLLPTDGRVIERIGGPIGFAIDSLPIPKSLDLSSRERLIFAATLLSALSLEVRDLMQDR